MMSGTKRKLEDDGPPSQLYSNKARSRRSTVEARVDPTYGQRSALPGLDNDFTVYEDGDEMDHDDEGLDALSYLRSVRQEATRIPNLLVAPPSPSNAYNNTDYEDGSANGGYYQDGAYYVPDPVSTTSDIADGKVGDKEGDPQLAYFDSILSRFETLRAQLQKRPPLGAVSKLNETHPITPPETATKGHLIAKWWRRQMQATNPAPAQVASMDKTIVLRGLDSLTRGKLLRSRSDIDISVSLWVWALLAKLPERGELSSEEIGIVRELGKRAALIGAGLSGEKDWQDGMHEIEAGLDEEHGDEGDEGSYAADEGEVQLDKEEDFDLENELSEPNSYAMIDGSLNRARQTSPRLSTALNDAQTANHYQNADGSSIIATGIMAEDSTMLDTSTEKRIEPSASSLLPEQQPSPPTASGQLPLYEPSQDSEEAQIAAAKARILASLDNEAAEPKASPKPEIGVPPNTDQEVRTSKLNTKATIDMILTVAGEIYGQRDLLEFRYPWAE